MFEDEAIRKIVMEQLVDVPEDHHIAFVTVANKESVKAVVAIKIKNEWEIEGYVTARKNAKLDYGAMLQWSK